MTQPTNSKIAAMIDHTLLKPDTTRAQVAAACRAAITHGFASVCVSPSLVGCAASDLAGTRVAPGTVIGFPMGANTTAVKEFEARDAVTNGARELDMVLAVARIKEGDAEYALRDMAAVVAAAPGCVVKVIIETCLLNDDEKRLAAELVVKSGAHFVKTSTGLAGDGATSADIRLLRGVVGPGFGVKASGGIRTLEQAVAMIEAGATRIGTSSALSFWP